MAGGWAGKLGAGRHWPAPGFSCAARWFALRLGGRTWESSPASSALLACGATAQGVSSSVPHFVSRTVHPCKHCPS